MENYNSSNSFDYKYTGYSFFDEILDNPTHENLDRLYYERARVRQLLYQYNNERISRDYNKTYIENIDNVIKELEEKLNSIKYVVSKIESYLFNVLL